MDVKEVKSPWHDHSRIYENALGNGRGGPRGPARAREMILPYGKRTLCAHRIWIPQQIALKDFSQVYL